MAALKERAQVHQLETFVEVPQDRTAGLAAGHSSFSSQSLPPDNIDRRRELGPRKIAPLKLAFPLGRIGPATPPPEA
eukprot:5818071-Pyramimonas_sp.AAC.1